MQRNPYEGIPNKHERNESEKNVSANSPLVAYGLIDHPKSSNICGKAKAHQENCEI
jgi:hypothetical protein